MIHSSSSRASTSEEQPLLQGHPPALSRRQRAQGNATSALGFSTPPKSRNAILVKLSRIHLCTFMSNRFLYDASDAISACLGGGEHQIMGTFSTNTQCMPIRMRWRAAPTCELTGFRNIYSSSHLHLTAMHSTAIRSMIVENSFFGEVDFLSVSGIPAYAAIAFKSSRVDTKFVYENTKTICIAS